MKIKSLGVATAMALVLFLYGYLLSVAGHEHGSHDEGSGGAHPTNVSDGSHTDGGHGDHHS